MPPTKRNDPAPRASTGCRWKGYYYLTPEKKRQWLWFVGLSLGGMAATWLLVRLARILARL